MCWHRLQCAQRRMQAAAAALQLPERSAAVSDISVQAREVGRVMHDAGILRRLRVLDHSGRPSVLLRRFWHQTRLLGGLLGGVLFFLGGFAVRRPLCSPLANIGQLTSLPRQGLENLCAPYAMEVASAKMLTRDSKCTLVLSKCVLIT